MNRGNNREEEQEEEAPPCYDDAVSEKYVDLERGGGSGTASGTAVSTYRHVDLDPSDTDGDVDGGRPRGGGSTTDAARRRADRDRELNEIRRAETLPTMVRQGPMIEYVGGVSGWPTASTPKSQVARFTMLGGYFAPMKLVPEFQPKLAGVPLEVNVTLHNVDQVLSASSAGHLVMLILHIFVALLTFPFGLMLFYFTFTFYINVALRRVNAYLLTENTTPTYKDAHLYWAVVDNFIELRTTSTGPDDGFYVLAPGRPCCCCWGCCRC